MKIALGIEYDGSGYHGWQRQDNASTVQQHLENILSKVANQEITVQCAGRTDAGVHALGQVLHFETTAARDLKAWVMGCNSELPDDICVCWGREVDDDFNARFSATARRYQYIIDNRRVKSALLRKQVTWHYQPLDAERMHTAGQYLLGELNFDAYRSSQCQSNTPMRNVMFLNVAREGDFIVIDIKANAFLHHMVRNIVGVLMEIGEGKQEPIWAQQVLLSQDRNQAARTAPAYGLYLLAVDYPQQFGLPTNERFTIRRGSPIASPQVSVAN